MNSIWDIAPIRRDLIQENELSLQYLELLMKWLPLADSTFQEWEVRPNCGHFFGGCHGLGSDTSYTAAVYAVLSQADAYDERQTGLSRAYLQGRAIQGIRYLGFTHGTGPADCVRTLNGNALNRGKKWGTVDDDFFTATQTGRSIAALCLAARFLWETLDEETRAMVQVISASYADRWSGERPRPGSYNDTQEEENGWTAMGISAALDLFPHHPNRSKWEQGFVLWSFNTALSFKDCYWREDRLPSLTPFDRPTVVPPIRRVTLHADYTTENHGFVHPDYMVAGIALRGMHAISSLIGGNQFESATLYNNVKLYEGLIKKSLQFDGGIIPVQGQDWYYSKYHEMLLVHSIMNVIHQDKEAAAIERKALHIVKQMQADHSSGSLLEENGDRYKLNPYQTLDMFEKFSAFQLVQSYLLHAFGGAGAKPASFETVWDRLQGVYEFPHGSLILHRSGRTLNAFNWRSNVMAISIPENGIWTATPLINNYIGELEFDNDEQLGPKGWENTSRVRFVERSNIQSESDGFGAVVSISRGGGKLLQDAAFVSLPGGASVYAERFRAQADCRIRRLQTGKIGIRNEKIGTLGHCASGIRTLYLPDGRSYRFEGFYGDVEDRVAQLECPSYVNVSHEIGYVLYGSRGVRYVNRHRYAKYTGLEDVLVLNDTESLHLAAHETTAPFSILTVPDRTADQTAQAAEQAVKWRTSSDDYQLLEYNGYLAYVNFDTEARQAEASKPFITGEWFPVYPGHYQIEGNTINWQGHLRGFSAGYLSETGRFVISPVEDRDVSTGEPRQDGDLSVRIFVLTNRAVFLNSGSVPFRMKGFITSDSRYVDDREWIVNHGEYRSVTL